MPNHNPPHDSGSLNVNIQVTDGKLGWAPDSLLVTSGKPVQVTFTLVNSPGSRLVGIDFIGDDCIQAHAVSDTVWQTNAYNPHRHKGKNAYSIRVVDTTGAVIEDDPDVNNEPPGGDDPGDDDQGDDEQGGGTGGETKNNQQ